MKKKSTAVPEGPINSYIQPSRELAGQPAHVVQDGWIAYFTLPSTRYARPAHEVEGKGFFKGGSVRKY